jgi:hypothetical protein
VEEKRGKVDEGFNKYNKQLKEKSDQFNKYNKQLKEMKHHVNKYNKTT